jgi:plastocyanin
MRALVFVALLLAVLALTPERERTALAQNGLGAVTGKVTLTARKGVPLATSAYGRRDVGPRATDAGSDTTHVIVFLAGVKQSSSPAPTRVRIAQRNEQFVPSVAAVTTGSTIDFPNEDPYFHNVFSLSRAATFDLGRYRSGQSKARILPTPGIVKVFCHLHAQMSAAIMVLDHPWFAIPDSDGTFSIRGIPAGRHTIVAWHERIGERRDPVTITPGGTAQVSFTLPVLEPQK